MMAVSSFGFESIEAIQRSSDYLGILFPSFLIVIVWAYHLIGTIDVFTTVISALLLLAFLISLQYRYTYRYI
ncbi:MAG: hypothetical protein ACJ71K_00935 [Nitrososphaeraceae archaeon]